MLRAARAARQNVALVDDAAPFALIGANACARRVVSPHAFAPAVECARASSRDVAVYDSAVIMESRMHRARATVSLFRTRDGRRFGLEFALIVGVKLTLLTLIWILCFRPYARPDTSPAAVRSHLMASPESAHDR